MPKLTGRRIEFSVKVDELPLLHALVQEHFPYMLPFGDDHFYRATYGGGGKEVQQLYELVRERLPSVIQNGIDEAEPIRITSHAAAEAKAAK